MTTAEVPETVSRQPIADDLVDSHVHFWDPGELRYPWHDDAPPLQRAFLPADYTAAVGSAPVRRLVFVEANPLPEQGIREARWVEGLAASDPRIAAIVAFVDLLDPRRGEALDALGEIPRVRGVRHNIQGHPAGFCLQPAFVEGVREAGRRGLSFDLCATHDQLGEVVELCRLCPDTALVLDHCGKPAVRERRLDPWRAQVRELAALEHVHCKLSGLLTEADAATRDDASLLPYARHVADCFGPARLMYGSDWPVLTLAGEYDGWYQFTRRFTAAWSDAERAGFYAENAAAFYRVGPHPAPGD